MRIPAIALLSLLATLPFVGGCSSPKVPTAAELGVGGIAAGPEYVIGPGDNLNVFVYRAPELSISLPVRPDGRVSIPLVSDIPAAGRTPSQLAAEIERRLKEYVKEPNVTVMVTSFVGPFDRQVRVIGEATQPIALPYRDQMTVLDVMIEAKGLTRFASGNSAQIVRRTGGKISSIPVRLSDLLRDGDVAQNVAMQPGDTLIIPQTYF
jgi:polysaccharide export outer membrane protein